MPIRVVTGPPFAGKSQAVAKVRRTGDILLDTTLLWKAFRDPGDVERSDADGQLANAMLRKGLDIGVEQGRDGWMIVASSRSDSAEEVAGRCGATEGVAGLGADGRAAERGRGRAARPARGC